MEKRISTDENEPYKCQNCGEEVSINDDSCLKCETQIPMEQKLAMAKLESGGQEGELSKHYDEKSFWEKVGRFALTAGREVIEKSLILYYCSQDSDTPAWAKATIIGALAYFIWPFDVIPDFLPGGYIDDLGALVAAFASVAVHIKEEHKKHAREQLKTLFG